MKIITITDVLLWLVHPLQGAAVVLFYYFATPILAILWFYGWLTYERQEYRQDKDTCYIDIRDFLIGLFAATAVVTAINIGRAYSNRDKEDSNANST